MKRKIGKWFVLVVAALVILSLSGCGRSDDVIYPGTIELNNNSIATIDAFYLAPVDQWSWGPNILSRPLFSGEQTLIVDIYPGFYDARIRAAGVYSDYFGYLYDIRIHEDDYLSLYVYNSSFTGSLGIRNNTFNANILEVYVVPVDATSWGVNQISSVIRPSEVRQLIDFAPGLYDVRIVWNFGPDSIYTDIRIDSLALTTLNVD